MGNHAVLRLGFLRTNAPFYADLVLLLEIGMALALLLGAFFARIHRYGWHALCQSVVVLVNLIVILLVMVPAFRSRILPKLPGKITKGYYLLPCAHAVVGIAAETAGLYILLAAGTKVLPERFRLRNYRLWMRTTLVLWWGALLLGIATYVRWY